MFFSVESFIDTRWEMVGVLLDVIIGFIAEPAYSIKYIFTVITAMGHNFVNFIIYAFGVIPFQ